MALTSKQKKQGAVVTAAVGALALGGVAVSTLGSSAAPANSADSKPIAAAAVPAPAASPSPSGSSSSSSATAITITAKSDNGKPADDTVFTVSGEVKGAKPGTKIRLQRQQTPTSANASPAWSTLAYTTFTDKSNKFSFPVKMETASSYNLRILHPQDREGPETAYSSPFAETVSATSTPASSSSSTKSPSSSSSSKKS
ncbi:hypothetical protein [Catenulispora rubra]|uniref:hypothetical protein n=1 Tax=Catenulispora rubra TaxID=280293 RepID=UPI0018925A8B|nr:hypothetical protein [Catenulispora rubra]